MGKISSYHSLNLVIPHDVWLQLNRFSDLTGFTKREIIICVLREEFTAFFADHPE